MLEVVWRPRAEADLRSIADYTEFHYGQLQTKRYVEEISRKIAFAAEFPGAGSEAMALPEIYRKLRSGSHRVIYRCDGGRLIVVRIIHEREDLPDDWDDFW